MTKRTLTIGMAGGSGTGKSTIAAHLVAKYGGVHVDGDRIAHAVLDDDGDVRERVRKVFDDAGGIDRRHLGRIVFADASRLSALNAIIHPAVVARSAAEVENARDAGVPLVVVDAALLLEVAMPFRFDLTVALRCDREERVRRLLAKGTRSEAEIRDRFDRQGPMEKHFYKADAVVDTGRDLAAVLTDVEALVDAARRRAKQHKPK